MNKTHKSLRIAGIIFSTIGLMLYLFLIFAGVHTYSYGGVNGLVEHIDYVLRFLILLPGLIPLLVITPFLIRFRTPKFFFIGLFLVTPFMIILHFLVAASAAHYDWSLGYITVQIIEFSTLFLVWFNRKAFFI